MTRDLCQVPLLEKAGVASLCDGCSRREGCADAFALSLIAEADGRLYLKPHLVAECAQYVADTGAFGGVRTHLGPELFTAGIRDLCEGCPEPERGDCGHRRGLDGLMRTAVARGTWIKPIVVACGKRHQGNLGQKLHQIAEPR